MSEVTQSPDLAGRVASARWYHGMALPGGIVTPGDYDMDDAIGRIPFPDDLTGVRCLDVGTRDGFFAFEMERRGASEVVGIDVFDPARVDFPHPRPAIEGELRAGLELRSSTFDIAKEALGSSAERLDVSVYDLPASGLGPFGFAFIGTLLLHLRDPIGALSAIHSVLEPGGTLISNEPYSSQLSLLHPRRPLAQIEMRGPRPFWWIANTAGRRRMVEAAGFHVTDVGRPYRMRYGRGWRRPASPGIRHLGDWLGWASTRSGAPHTAIVARSRG
jgi:tRNA (mo5U34)-methyltransferase